MGYVQFILPRSHLGVFGQKKLSQIAIWHILQKKSIAIWIVAYADQPNNILVAFKT
jgi:hypothetical protein